MKFRQLFMLFVPALILAGCSAESEWKSATSQNTIAAYQNYLSRHPTGPHNVEAGARIQLLQDDAAWSQAKGADTVASYQAYLQEAVHTHRIEAQSAVSDHERTEAWESARARGTVASMQEFLRQYPRGIEADHARAKLKELAGFTVQLGSRSSKRRAQSARTRLVAKYGRVLHNVVIVPPSVQDHSYVLTSAPMSEREARSACETLEMARQKCAVAATPAAPSAIAAR